MVWYGAHLAVAGTITPGELVTFFGYAAFLTQPLDVATEALRIGTRAVVGVRRMLRVLSVAPTGADTRERPLDLADPAPAGDAVDLVDERTGVVLPAGRLTALVSPDPDESAALALRLGLLGEGHDATRVRLGGVPLAELGLAEVRRRVVVAESTPHLFTGSLRAELDVRGGSDDAAKLAALHTADAHDVLEAVPDGLDGHVTEKGRSLSGGQRQRLALARALLTEAEVLVLVEPTSAVDAHTEARIARAARGRTRGAHHRRGHREPARAGPRRPRGAGLRRARAGAGQPPRAARGRPRRRPPLPRGGLARRRRRRPRRPLRPPGGGAP